MILGLQKLRARKKKNCQNVRKKEVEKLEAKKPPRACCAQVPMNDRYNMNAVFFL